MKQFDNSCSAPKMTSSTVRKDSEDLFGSYKLNNKKRKPHLSIEAGNSDRSSKRKQI